MSSDKCSHGALLTEDCEDCWAGPSGYVKPIRNQPAEDERVKEARRFVQGFGLSGSTVDRDYATSLIRHLLSLLPVQPAQQEDDGWVTFGRIKTDIENETETFERIPVQPAQSNRQILSEMPDSQCAHSDWCSRWVGSKPRSYHPEIECSCGAAVQPAASTPTDASQLYDALENMLGDLYLLGLAEIKLEDIYAGSARDAMKVLKRLQEHRSKDPQLAIGQKPHSKSVIKRLAIQKGDAAATTEAMPTLPYICPKCNVQQHAAGLCANCGYHKVNATSPPDFTEQSEHVSINVETDEQGKIRFLPTDAAVSLTEQARQLVVEWIQSAVSPVSGIATSEYNALIDRIASFAAEAATAALEQAAQAMCFRCRNKAAYHPAELVDGDWQHRDQGDSAFKCEGAAVRLLKIAAIGDDRE